MNEEQKEFQIQKALGNVHYYIVSLAFRYKFDHKCKWNTCTVKATTPREAIEKAIKITMEHNPSFRKDQLLTKKIRVVKCQDGKIFNEKLGE